MPGAICERCGKQLRSSSQDAIAAHQRDSSHCVPKTKGAVGEVARLEAQLQQLTDEGRRLEAGKGSYEEVQANLRQRQETEAALKAARKNTKDEKKLVKNLAKKSMSVEGWTQALLDGDARFSCAQEGLVEERLTAQTVGLVSGAAFRQKREQLEAEAARKRAHEEDKEQEKKSALHMKNKQRKLKREQEQKRTLSFTDDDDG
mgnify:CR=1 FL=1